MSTLEKPTTPQTETGQIPVEQMGIFLKREKKFHFSLRPGAEPTLPEVVSKVHIANISGRLLGMTATPGSIEIRAVPDEEGNL